MAKLHKTPTGIERTYAATHGRDCQETNAPRNPCASKAPNDCASNLCASQSPIPSRSMRTATVTATSIVLPSAVTLNSLTGSCHIGIVCQPPACKEHPCSCMRMVALKCRSAICKKLSITPHLNSPAMHHPSPLKIEKDITIPNNLSLSRVPRRNVAAALT